MYIVLVAKNQDIVYRGCWPHTSIFRKPTKSTCQGFAQNNQPDAHFFLIHIWHIGISLKVFSSKNNAWTKSIYLNSLLLLSFHRYTELPHLKEVVASSFVGFNTL